jgi:predicted phage baseplate assembly protein
VPLQAPVIDNRRFDDIVAEAKTRISRYTPEWTNHNESDPGITLVQLFAWMTELLIYRLNQVPELNYVKFLQLLGIELEPAQPASTELTFTLTPEAPGLAPEVLIPLATQVAPGGAGGATPPPVFETQRALVALRASLAFVQVYDGFSFARADAVAPADGEPFFAFGRHTRDGSALYLGFASTLPFTAEQVDLAFSVAGGIARAGYACELELARLPLPATIVWEYWDRYGDWRPLNVVEDETHAFSRSGHVYVSGPGAEAGKTHFGLATDDLYWFRARLVTSTYERAPQLDAVLTNTVAAAQAITVRDEVLGGVDGSIGQTFRTANVPLVPFDPPLRVPRRSDDETAKVDVRTVRLEIDEGQGFEVWEEVGDFLGSGPRDAHFTVNRATGEIAFGDGDNGRVPVANPDQPGNNVVARVYRYGGGAVGNVGAGSLSELQSNIPGVAAVTNRLPATGGTNEETVDHAKERAPQELKSKGRAVTAGDFEQLAREAPGARVARVKALPLVHPQFRDTQVPGVVTVIVVPESDHPTPTPNETTVRAVCAYLNAHRLLTTELYVVPPTYRRVAIETEVIVQPSFDLARVQADVDARLRQYFDPLRGGPDGEGWDFGADVYFSDVYRLIFDVPGVDRVDPGRLYIWLDEDRFGPCVDVQVPELDLLYSGEHEVRVSYQERQ